MLELVLGGLAILGAGLLAWMLMKRKEREKQEEQQRQQAEKQAHEERRRQMQRAEEEGREGERRRLQKEESDEELERIKREQGEKERAEMQKRIAVVKKILSGDPDVARALLSETGMSGAIEQIVSDPRNLLQIAQKFSPEYLEMMKIAGTQSEITFNLQKRTERVPVNYPTRDVEQEQITDMGQLTDISPEQMMLEDEDFDRRLATFELTRQQFYETDITKKLGYLLLDISPSMKDGKMSNGFSRAVWARGIAVKLLMMAVRGEAAFLLRFFSSCTTNLVRVDTPEQALKFIKVLSEQQSNGSGTAIGVAIGQAVSDIRGMDKEIQQSHILIITDGEDNLLQEDSLKTMLGEDIFLHTVLLGGIQDSVGGVSESPVLKSVSTSYQKFV